MACSIETPPLPSGCTGLGGHPFAILKLTSYSEVFLNVLLPGVLLFLESPSSGRLYHNLDHFSWGKGLCSFLGFGCDPPALHSLPR